MTVSVLIEDNRPELTKRYRRTFENVPSNLTDKEILERYGIAKHWTVYRIEGDKKEVIQQGSK